MGLGSKERTFWALMKRNLGPRLRFLERVENKCGRGWPDVHGVADYGCKPFWMELKVVTRGNKIRFQPSQPLWISAYPSCVYVATRILKPNVEEAIRIDGGSRISELVEKGIKARAYALYHKPYDWDQIAEELKEATR